MKTPEIEKRPGVYQITNLVNGHRYIGSSVNVYHRLQQHKSDLKCSRHGNQHLQRAYDKYGAGNFTVNILLYCERDETTDREQEFLDKLKPEYNIAKNTTAPALDSEVSAETRAKLSENSKRLWQSEEYKMKMRITQQSEEYKMKMRITQQSEETKAKQKAAWQERKENPEAMAEWRAAQKSGWQGERLGELKRKKGASEWSKQIWQERKANPEAMAEWSDKVSKALTGIVRSEESRAKMSKAKHNMTEETKAKMSAILKERWQDEEYREEYSEAKKAYWQRLKANPEAFAEWKAKVAAGKQRKKEEQNA